jgi:hypothetical protein
MGDTSVPMADEDGLALAYALRDRDLSSEEIPFI